MPPRGASSRGAESGPRNHHQGGYLRPRVHCSPLGSPYRRQLVPQDLRRYDGPVSDLYPCLCTARKERLNATRTECGEDWCRTRHFRSRTCSPSADADIAARGEDASSTRTECREQVTHSRRVFQRDIRLLHTVPQADHLDARLVEHVVKPLKVPRRVVRP